MRVRPLHDQVLVMCEPLKEEFYEGILVSMPHQQRVRHGRVIAVGPGVKSYRTGKYRPLDVGLGARVAFFRENMETLNGKQIVRAMQDLSDRLGADVALIPESSILGEVDKDTKVSA